MGPLAEVIHNLGYDVSGSDLVDSASLNKMRSWSDQITINIGQDDQQIAQLHHNKPIDWYIYSSALAWADPPNQELAWVKKQSDIKVSKRDEFLNYLINHHNLKLLAISGSHAKTTTTGLLIWAWRQLHEYVSYAIGSKLINQPAAQIEPKSEWFIYEADEFDYNFLSFEPNIGLISGLDYDHFEVYPTLESYQEAYKQFITQSKKVFMIDEDCHKLYSPANMPKHITTVRVKKPDPELKLIGEVNRQNAQLALRVLQFLHPQTDKSELINILNNFEGCWRRFEEIAPNVFSDYAHNPVKIAGCLQIASELNKPIVAVYEPHSHRRQVHVKNQYKDLFNNVAKLYWLPSHPAREDPQMTPLSPEELIASLSNPQIAEVAHMNDDLKHTLQKHLAQGTIVVGMSASGLDTWLRDNFGQKKYLKF